jgi:hypothetical protein
MTPEYKMIDNVLMKRKRSKCVEAYTTDESKFDTCSICLKNTMCDSHAAKHRYCKQLDCGHLFHVDCVNRWLLKHIVCPLCRSMQYTQCNYLSVSSSPYKLYCVKPFHYNIYKL